MPAGQGTIYGAKLAQFKKTGQYDLSAKPVSVMPVYAGGGRFGAMATPAPIALPDTSGIRQTGKVVSVTPDNYARSFVPPIYQNGKVIREESQALFVHPTSGKWVSFAELPIGQDGLRQSLGQQDGNPFVNREGRIDVARPKEESAWVEFRNSAAPMLGVAAPLLAAAAVPAIAASAAGAGSAAPGIAGASSAPIGSGLFAGGVEAAATGAPAGTFIGGGGSTLGGFGGLTGAAAPAGFTTPTLGLGATQVASTGGLSGLLGWLGSPTGQAVSQLGSAALQSAAAQRAGAQQTGAAQAGIEEQRRQFEAMRSGLAPFQQAGTQALGGFAPFQQTGLQAFQQQQALAGLQGQPAQQQAISALEQSPLYQSLAKQGEEAMLQRASATGGLRGGNIQAALAQFRPAMLQQLIDQQYARLGGLAGTGLETTANLAKMGQSAAAMQGEGGLNAASNIGRLLAQQGQAQAGGTLGMAQGIGQLFNIPSQMAGQQRANALADILSRI